MTKNSTEESPRKKKIVAIHQPNYIPWLGYFYKINRCDIFVYLDSVQYPRGRSFASRNRIKTPHGAVYLTIPVHIPEGHSGKVSYSEVEFADQKWKQKHLRTIELNYKRAPYFAEIFQLYETHLNSDAQFCELNIQLIEAIAEYLDITTERVRLSQLLTEFGKKTDLIIDICHRLDARIYLSGTGGGKSYNEEARLNANGIELIYSDFKHPTYPQLWGDFIPNLSVLDVLFNCGPDSKNFL